jgi:Rrf2 family protein
VRQEFANVQWNARTQYACLAVVELGRQFPSGAPIQIKAISEKLAIPTQFLVQILLQLKSVGLVSSTRGAAGGYQLTRHPEEVSVWDVIQAVDPSHESPTAEAGSAERVALVGVFRQAEEAAQEVFRRTTVAEMIDRIDQHRDPMYFI